MDIKMLRQIARRGLGRGFSSLEDIESIGKEIRPPGSPISNTERYFLKILM